MKFRGYLFGLLAAGAVALSTSVVLSQEKKDDAKAKPAAKGQEAKPGDKAAAGAACDPAMMEQMMQLAQPGENHKLLQHSVGDWTYTTKCYQDPSQPPQVSTGTATFRSAMDGRYVIGEHKGKMSFPGPDGKMMDMMFEGMGITGYDNVKKKFVNSWIDNMGTGIFFSDGTYDAATKTFTYKGEMEMIPGTKTPVREVIKIVGNDAQTFEWYETRGTQEVRMMEITYARKK